MLAVTAMELPLIAEELATGQPSRRATPRYGVDEDARLLLVQHGSSHACRIVDLSLTGCRVRTKEKFPACANLRVEVNFKVRGLAFRFCGMTQWTDGRHTAGIRFVDVPQRRKDDLVEALGEVAEETEAKAARLAAEKVAAEQQAAELAAEKLAAEQRAAEMQAAEKLAAEELAATLKAAAAARQAEKALAQSVPQAPAPGKAAGRERREETRELIDTSAVIHLINIASRLQGRILDLSRSGCRIRTGERFPVGIYTRVETEFRLDGLPFRLGGVIQSIHDRNTVGIRFLDMSDRRREQVEQLMEVIHEMKERN
jgi:hypothetical protein